ncbi:multiheme c-type cytochrome [Aliiglaciecola sp. LCG003]|uniref:multiheme c-type cytochrome n=1 Tax=Aliiglaciecola sp. LCG003 TaxID=3053655 RepID=UPI0025736ED3|nr:multiheme c-type cytochrome [Aliiglaciecola sp. LCG003]WJG10171.1 multiheme c-type cytochrome [Aliiglaciecola sp. LCG003]
MRIFLVFFPVLCIAIIAFIWFGQEDYAQVFHAEYVGSEVCGDCHIINYDGWKMSPHHNITNEPSDNTVVGNFNDGVFYLNTDPEKSQPAVKSFKQNGEFYLALKNIRSQDYTPFKIEKVIGYQYRQTYLTQEEGGVLRRLPVQWSVARGEFFAYWNEQEQSPETVQDLWEQMKPLNSAWNLYCARCHTTNLQQISKNRAHTFANVKWTEDGVGCEVCHGPGSAHVDYMQDKPVNRVMSLVNLKLFEQPVPYIMNAADHSQGVALSVCARCHGADILRKRMDAYRTFFPGYNLAGELNDLSEYFTEAESVPGRTFPTLQIWPDGRPKGLGTLFRSFADSKHYEDTDMRCYDCHDPHNNKRPTEVGILEASEVSNEFCVGCHQPIVQNLPAHTRHKTGSQGSYCYDCHMPKNLLNQVSGIDYFVRSHNMGTIPNPLLSVKLGLNNSPNACNECHSKQTAQWAVDKMREWGMDKHLVETDLHLNRNAHSDIPHSH